MQLTWIKNNKVKYTKKRDLKNNLFGQLNSFFSCPEKENKFLNTYVTIQNWRID